MKSVPVDTQTVLVPENTVSGFWTTIWVQRFDTVFVPSVADRVTVYTPGVSKTCAANGPISVLRLLTPAFAPYPHVVPLTGEPAVSPKSQRYSRSWNGVVVAVAVVPEALKNTDNGATPVKRLAALERAMALVAPVVEHADADEAATVTVVLLLEVPPRPVHVTV